MFADNGNLFENYSKEKKENRREFTMAW